MSSYWMNRGSLMAPGALDDRGFRFGWRVMTTMLVVKGVIVDFDRHMERLRSHAERMGLDAGFRPEIIRFEIEGMIASHPCERAACRVYITAGPGTLNDAVLEPQRWLHWEPLSAPESQQSSLSLQVVADSGWAKGSRIKTGLYGEMNPAVAKAQRDRFDDVLWCNADQEIAETTTANIFLIGRDGDLVEIATPPPSSGVLAGVTKQRIIDLLAMAKIPVTERVIYKEEIPRYDEAFVTSSLRGPVPVGMLGHHKLSTTRPQAVFHHILRLWTTWLATQLGP